MKRFRINTECKA